MNKLLHLQHSTPADILIKGVNLAIAVEKFSSYKDNTRAKWVFLNQINRFEYLIQHLS